MADSDINIDICNLALSHVRGYPIQSITASSQEARECRRLYLPAKDSTLEFHDWSFARKEKTLAVVSGETRSGWTYIYEFPSDCLAPRKIHNAASQHKKIPFEVGVNSALNKRRIFTNEENAILIYTAQVVDANIFTVQFKEALALKLGSDLAVPLNRDSKLKDDLYKAFTRKVLGSAADDANTSHKDYDDEPNPYVDAR